MESIFMNETNKRERKREKNNLLTIIARERERERHCL